MPGPVKVRNAVFLWLGMVCLAALVIRGVTPAPRATDSKIVVEKPSKVDNRPPDRNHLAIKSLAKKDVGGVSAEPNVINLAHHFGNVKPNRTYEHEFQLTNPTSKSWHVRQIASSCGCTVPRLGATIFRPGEQVPVHVAYHTGTRQTDEARVVLLEFVEGDAPRVRLHLQARVRDVINAIPSGVIFQDLLSDEVRSSYFEVSNCSDGDWEGINVRSASQRVSVQVVPAPDGLRTRRLDGARQLWRVLVNVDARLLSPGTHEHVIFVTPVGFNSPPLTVSVQSTVINPITPVPSRLVFTQERLASPITGRLKLILSQRYSTVATNQLDVHVNGSLPISPSLIRISSNVIGLEVSAFPASGPEFQEGEITVSLRGVPQSRVKIPYYVRLKGAANDA